VTSNGLIDSAQSGRGFWELLVARSDATPDALLALDERGQQVTFAEYRDRAEVVAAGLADRGVGEGSVVVWQLPTWIESFVLMGALVRLGATQVPLIPSYRAREVSFIIRQTGAEFFVVPSPWKKFDYPDMARTIAAEVDGLDVLVVDAGNRELPTGDPTRLAPVPPAPADAEDFPVRWVYFTSGTTASPKGTRHTDATLFGAVAGMVAMLEPGPGDRSSMVFPFAHIGGVVWLLTSFVCGSAHLVVESFNAETTIPMLAANDVTLAGTGTPFNLAYLQAQRELTASSPGARLFPRVRGFMSGASPKPPTLHADLRDELGGTGILSSYGMTEAPIVTFCGPHASEAHRASTEGKASPGVDLKVLTADGTPARPGEPGEIRLKGPQLCRGYLDASLNEDAFDQDGYIKTGDLGTLDEEGFLTIVGRLKDVIIRNGENISAKEIEDLLFAHPAVRDVAVIGLPDPRVGERCCAVVALDESKGSFGFEEMVTFLKSHDLMVQKLPEQLEILDSVPRNAAGKVLKEQLRNQFSAASSR
jgi:acyl-CoA synthetase (AMP-forming)/AMP-acid ligase II